MSNCKTHLSSVFLSSVLPHNLVLRMEKFLLARALEADPAWRPCPTPDCSNGTSRLTPSSSFQGFSGRKRKASSYSGDVTSVTIDVVSIAEKQPMTVRVIRYALFLLFLPDEPESRRRGRSWGRNKKMSHLQSRYSQRSRVCYC